MRCWDLIRYAFQTHRNVVLPESPFDAIRQFVKVHNAETWDVAVIKNGPIENHVALMLTSTSFLHSMRIGSDVGPETDDTPREITIAMTHRAPWNDGRIVRYLRFRE